MAQEIAAVTTKQYAVQFCPMIKPGNEAAQIAAHLTFMIGEWEKTGWSFSHLENVISIRNNGCIAGLLGNGFTEVVYQVAVLKKIG